MAAGKEAGDLGEIRKKLLSFLETSSSYEPARLISDFPFDGNCFYHTNTHTGLKAVSFSEMEIDLLRVFI